MSRRSAPATVIPVTSSRAIENTLVNTIGLRSPRMLFPLLEFPSVIALVPFTPGQNCRLHDSRFLHKSAIGDITNIERPVDRTGDYEDERMISFTYNQRWRSLTAPQVDATL